MRIQIYGKDFAISDTVRKLINDKFIIKIEKFLTHLDNDKKTAKLKIQEETRWGYHVNFDMWLPGKEHIYAEETADKLPQAITHLRQEVEQQIKSYMGKVRIKNSNINNSN